MSGQKPSSLVQGIFRFLVAALNVAFFGWIMYVIPQVIASHFVVVLAQEGAVTTEMKVVSALYTGIILLVIILTLFIRKK